MINKQDIISTLLVSRTWDISAQDKLVLLQIVNALETCTDERYGFKTYKAEVSAVWLSYAARLSINDVAASLDVLETRGYIVRLPSDRWWNVNVIKIMQKYEETIEMVNREESSMNEYYVSS